MGTRETALTHTVSDRASVTAAAQKRQKNPKTHTSFLHRVSECSYQRAYLSGISGRELRALASGTQRSSLGRILLVQKTIQPGRTFVRAIYHRLVRVVLQPAVAIDEVHHVLRRGDGGYVDGEALQGDKTGCSYLNLQKKKHNKNNRKVPTVVMGVLCVPVWPPGCPGEPELCHRSEASIEPS